MFFVDGSSNSSFLYSEISRIFYENLNEKCLLNLGYFFLLLASFGILFYVAAWQPSYEARLLTILQYSLLFIIPAKFLFF